MDKSVTKSVQLLVKILDNTTTIYMYMLFGSLGCYPKDHTKSMEIKIGAKSQLAKCTHLCRIAVSPQLPFPHMLVCVTNLISDMMPPIHFKFLIYLIDILTKRLKHF